MKFLILTEPDDMHALFVKLALNEVGHHVRLLFTADLPTKQKNSVFIDQQRYEWKSTDRRESVVDNDYDVVWWRRARRPYLPKDIVHPDDYKFVAGENQFFYDALMNNLAPNAWWVNRKEAAIRANSKLLQLKMAVACGLEIPVTLCSNDPHDIRYFLLKHESEGVIYKPLCSNFWFETQEVKVAYTNKITFLDLPMNKLLQLTPGIFQKEVTKKYELRVMCFGDYLVAAKLYSQEHQEGQIDWRAIPEGEMRIEPYVLPEAIKDKIRAFMRRMGLVFGALDFIVSTDEQYVFLEVNQQGQFLWLEEYCRELQVLDIFVHFLLNQSPHFQWDSEHAEHTLARYRPAMLDMMNENMRHHVDLNSETAYHSMSA